MFMARRSIESFKPIHYPGLEAGRIVYAIGDIHGRADLLEGVHQRIDADMAATPDALHHEIYLGDYIDRGPSSAQVVDALIERSHAVRMTCVMGNHEELLLGCLRGEISFSTWRKFGGMETLSSYGATASSLSRFEDEHVREIARRLVGPRHMSFFEALRPYVIVNDYAFVHAGMRPNVPIANQAGKDLRWIRGDFLTARGDFGYIVVHGHTTVPKAEFLSNRINIDTAAYISNELSCLRIDENGPELLA